MAPELEVRPRKRPARAERSRSRELQEESSSQPQISGRVSNNLAPDPFTLCFNDSDTCVLQKKCQMIKYDSDAEELERLMIAVGRGSNPQEEYGTEQEAPSSVIGQPESRDLTSEIEVLEGVMPSEDTCVSCLISL